MIKHKIFIAIAVLAAVTLVSGASLLAAASPATSTDPLVTLNYLNGPFKTTITSEINTAIKELENRLTEAENAIKTGGGPGASANVFTVRDLSAGTKLTITPGSEVMAESGTVSYSGELVKVSGTPGSASSGTLAVYNMYIAAGTVELTAGTAAKLWVRNGSN